MYKLAVGIHHVEPEITRDSNDWLRLQEDDEEGPVLCGWSLLPPKYRRRREVQTLKLMGPDGWLAKGKRKGQLPNFLLDVQEEIQSDDDAPKASGPGR